MRFFKMYGGGRGIRTPAGFNTPVGFQDRSLQPDLGIPPYQQNIIYHGLMQGVNYLSAPLLRKYIQGNLSTFFVFIDTSKKRINPSKST